jgi:ABC-type multidrug transport system, ATPase and permease components
MINKYNIDEKDTKFKFDNYKKGFAYILNHKKKMIIVIILNFINIFFGLSLVKITEFLINTTLPNKDYNQLLFLVLGNLGIALLMLVTSYFARKALNELSQDIMEKMRNDLFIHTQHLSTNFFDTRPNGKILVRLTTYVNNVYGMLARDVPRLITSSLNIVLTVIFMFITNVSLSLFTFVGILILSIVFLATAKKKRSLQQEVNNKGSNLTAYTVESIRGVSITQAFNREKENEKIYSGLTGDLYDKVHKIMPYWNINWVVAWQIEDLTIILMYIIGFVYLFPTVAIGTVIAMASYSKRLWSPVRMIFSSFDELINSVTYLERIFELLEEPIDIKNSDSSKKIQIKGNIKFDEVNFGYNKDKQVLKNVSFEIKPKTKVAFVGSTGSGKSTIVNLIERFYDTNSGAITIDGVNIKDIDLGSLRKQTTIMLQDNYLFTTSILDNIRYGNPKATKNEVTEVCKKLKLHDWILGLEKGYDTVLSNNGKELSDGQRQLLSYARTIIANPKIIILDEATSKIDTSTEKIIDKTLQVVLKDKTVIVIAHRLSTITNSDTIYYLSNGEIKESGSHKELMKKKSSYHKLFTSQNKV